MHERSYFQRLRPIREVRIDALVKILLSIIHRSADQFKRRICNKSPLPSLTIAALCRPFQEPLHLDYSISQNTKDVTFLSWLKPFDFAFQRQFSSCPRFASIGKLVKDRFRFKQSIRGSDNKARDWTAILRCTPNQEEE